MKQIGNRIIFNQDGKIIFQYGDMKTTDDSFEREVITKLDYIDLPYGFIDFNTHYIDSIDIETKKPIIKQYEVIVSDEILKREQLERENAELAYQLMIGGN